MLRMGLVWLCARRYRSLSSVRTSRRCEVNPLTRYARMLILRINCQNLRITKIYHSFSFVCENKILILQIEKWFNMESSAYTEFR